MNIHRVATLMVYFFMRLAFSMEETPALVIQREKIPENILSDYIGKEVLWKKGDTLYKKVILGDQLCGGKYYKIYRHGATSGYCCSADAIYFYKK
jgi:hypothetical protein